MSAWGQGSTRAARRARNDCLDFYDHICQLRHTGCTNHATEAHHINGLNGRPRSQATDPGELLAVCSWCHSIETKAQAAHGRRARRARLTARGARPHPGD